MSKPHHSGVEKLVAPRDEITPSALAGPGVSRPTARTAARGVPVAASTDSSAPTIASTAICGPSTTRLGTSTSVSTRNSPADVRTVALLEVPPLSRPTTTQDEGRAAGSAEVMAPPLHDARSGVTSVTS